MASVSQQLSMELMNQISQRFDDVRVKKATQAVADKAIDIMRERTMKGVDVNGKRFAKLTPKYQKAKARLIKSGVAKNQWGAKGLPSHIRLSGTLFASMKNQLIQYAQFSNDKVNSTFRIYIDASQEKKVQGLLSDTGRSKKGTYRKAVRNFFGIATKGVLAKEEENKLFLTFIKEMNFQVRKGAKGLVIK